MAKRKTQTPPAGGQAADTSDVASQVIDSAAPDDGSPEMRSFHDAMFDAETGLLGDLYGSPDDWPAVLKAGHSRRIGILQAKTLANLGEAVAVDFGTGPWGFGCIFPRLREAKQCIGMDVSLTALEIAATHDVEIAHKTTYMTSDGETIPLDDNSVDIFWAGEVIEHVREPRRFMQEVARVCRDGARVLMSTPNRAAFFYAAHGEEYSTGPEHMALMDFDELQSIVSLFLRPVSIVGYETSLYPSIDAVLLDEDGVRRIQDRALANPTDASGLIVDGRVSKALAARNSRDWRLEELLWSATSIKGQQPMTEAPLFAGVTGGALEPDAPFSVNVQGNEIILLFWAHDWSGFVEVDIDGERRNVDLYSPGGGFRRVEFSGLMPHQHLLKVRRTGQKRDKAHDSQVILYKIMAYTLS
jgi:SAM-dependent methyltransferase